MTYFEYIEDMKRDEEGYKITIKEFCNWLDKENLRDRFFEEVNTMNIESVAMDFTIPIIMIKALTR